MPTLDRPASILDSSVTVALYIHDGTKWVYRSIGSDGTWLHHTPAGSHADDLSLAFVRSAGEYRLKEPVPLPAAAFTAFTVAGYNEFMIRRMNSGRRLDTPAASAA